MGDVRRAALALVLSLGGAAVAPACSRTPYPEVTVDMGASRVATTGGTAKRPRSLRFSVAAMQSPRGTYAAYSRMFDLLGHTLGVDVELVQRRTYAEVNDMLASGKLDAALICTGGYLDLQRRAPGSVEVLAIPVMDGRTMYRSYIIVPAASHDRILQQLRGKRFAFTDELSLSGFTYIAHLLKKIGSDYQSFFQSVTFTRSHDRSIEAIANGLFDGAAVDSLVFDQLAKAKPEIGAAVHIIHRSPEFGVSPVVISTRIPSERREALRNALLTLHEKPGGTDDLRVAGIDRFVEPPPELYTEARRVASVPR